MANFAKIVYSLTIGALLLLPLDAASAQNQDSLIGTWNESGALSDGTLPFIAVMDFNAGGTTVEFDTGGGNSSTVESINLGKWKKTGPDNYTFKDQNYVYDTSGNLADININVCKVTLDATLNRFSGSCNFAFYTCSLTSCPGTLVFESPGNIRGTRF